MSWQSLLRKAGYEKKNVKDAITPLEVGEVRTQDLNGSVVGDPCNCCGARLIRRALGAKFVWVGAEFCVIAYDEKRIIRYTHNGGIPSMQDKGFFPLGEPLRLKPPGKWSKLGAQRHLPSQKRKRPYAKRFPSIVGQFRR
jgi:hypothetical protein